DTQHNWRVREIAEIIADVFTGCQLSFGQPNADNRSYRVNFDKIHSALPAFICDWDARRGAEQLHALFTRIGMTAELFEARPFTRLKMLEHLLRTRQIEADFFWRRDGEHGGTGTKMSVQRQAA